MPTKQAFEEQFRERFENLEEAPPAFAWNKIRQEIAQPVAVKAKPPKLKWLLPGAVIAVISVALLFMLKYNKALENKPASHAKEYALQAEAEELPEPVTEIAPLAPGTKAQVASKPTFKAYEPKTGKETPAADFVKKSYLKGAEKPAAPENLKAAAKKKLPATKVVYVVTVDPKSASVEKFSTAVSDSVAAGTAN